MWAIRQWIGWWLNPHVIVRLSDGISFDFMLDAGASRKKFVAKWGEAIRSGKLIEFRYLDGRQGAINARQVVYVEYRWRP